MLFPRLLFWLALWLVALVMLLAGLALSPWGTAWLLGQAQSRGLISYSSVEGAPLDTLVLHDVALDAAGVQLEARRLELSWSSDCLLRGRLCIERLASDGLHVRLPAAAAEQSESESAPLERISTPLPIELRELVLDDFSLETEAGLELAWQHFESSASFEGSRFSLGETRLVSPRLRLSDAAEAAEEPAAIEAPSLESEVDVAAALAVVAAPAVAPGSVLGADGAPIANPLAALSATPLDDPQARITLTRIELPVDVQAPSLEVTDFRLEGEPALVLDRIDLALHAEGSSVRLERLALQGPELEAELAFELEMSGDYPLSLDLSARSELAPLQGESVELRLRGSLAALEVEMNADGPVAARLDAGADLFDQQLPFELALRSPRLDWPLPGMPGEDESGAPVTRYQVEELALDLDGSLAGYRLDLSGRASGDELQPLDLSLVGEGDFERFGWSVLQVVSGGGRIESQGEVRWAPTISLDTELTLHQLRPERFTPAVNGLLNGSARLAFQQQADQRWALQVPNLAIDGQLMNQPLSLAGRLDGDSSMRWNIERLDLRQGPNRVTASGVVDQRLALNADIDAPNLGGLLPELGGRLAGQLRVSGTLEQPQGSVTLNGEQLRYGDNHIARLALEGRSDGLEDPRFELRLDASDALAGGQALARLGLSLEGRLSDHRLSLELSGGQDALVNSASLALRGGLDQANNRYRGQLSSLEADLEQGGELSLDSPLGFVANLDAASATVEPFCLSRREGGRLCLTERMTASAASGSAALRLSELPLEAANPWMPEPWQVAGEAGGDVRAQWSNAGQRWNVDARLDGDLQVSGEDAAGESFSIPALSLGVGLEASPAQADLTLDARLRDAGQLRLEARVIDPLDSRQLGGRLQVEGLDFAPYRALVAGLDTLEGRLDGDVTISGDLEQPRFNGQLVVSGVRAGGEQLPVTLDDARVALRLEGDHGVLDGYISSNQARWTLGGEANWPTTGDWRATLALRGADSPLEVAALGYGRVRVAPSIDVLATPQRLDISGRVTIPWARIEVAQLPASAQAPSSDEVIVTREEAERIDASIDRALAAQAEGEEYQWADASALEEAGIDLNLNVQVVMGDDVRLSAYGLNSRLAGAINVRQSGGALQLFGSISLQEGRFASFGQNLLINRGEVIFSGPPSLPRLDFEAIRSPDTIEDDVTAGIRVTGNADAPQLSIFSDPSMNETTALSYLLRGRAPDAEGDDNALASALIGLSVSQSGRAIGSLGETFGIQDLSLDTAGSGDTSQVVVSGYIFPDLRVSYGVGMFTSLAELTLRYRLMQNLYLQAVSGGYQALDLLYTFSFGRTPDPQSE